MVTVFSKPACVQCDFTIRLLNKLGYPYKTVDVTEDPDGLTTLKEMGYLAAPVVLTPEGEHWSGFRPDLIEALV